MDKKPTTLQVYWDRFGAHVILFLLAAAGVVLLQLFEPGGKWESKYGEHVAMGMLVAGVIGLLIEFTLHKRFADNVFKAAVGYLLREDLRGELEWIYGQSILCNDFIATVTISHLEKEGLVEFECDLHRTYENISMRTATASFKGGTDEWFTKDHPTQVLEVSFKKLGTDAKTTLAHKPSEDGIGWEGEIDLSSGEEVNFMVKTLHYHRENDTFIFTSRYPVKNPKIIIKCDASLRPKVIFDHRSKYATNWETATNTWFMRGVLLPHQDIRVKWHRKDLIEERKKAT